MRGAADGIDLGGLGVKDCLLKLGRRGAADGARLRGGVDARIGDCCGVERYGHRDVAAEARVGRRIRAGRI